MSDNELRLSQLITTFGPGAMVDLPTHSVIISGLDFWPHMMPHAMRTIDEPRLRELLESELKRVGRLPEESVLELKEPPVSDDMRHRRPPKVPAHIFPEWFVCAPSGEASSGTGVRRRMIWFSQLSSAQKATFKDGGTTYQTTPIRFVGACKKGHLQDLNWRTLVHPENPSCREELYLVDRGTSGDPKDISIECSCGARIDLVQLYAPGRLGMCQGQKPWLRDENEPCAEQLHFLTRGAVNAYFGQALKLISLPEEGDKLTNLVRTHLASLSNVKNATHVEVLLDNIEQLRSAFKGHSPDQIFATVTALKKQKSKQASQHIESPKVAEFDILASGDAEIGSNAFGSRLYAETLEPERWQGADELPPDLLEKIVRVHKLRAVSCLFGFTRLEPAPGAYDDGQDELELSVEGAPLGKDVSWLPAIEQFGEGIFLQFSAQGLKDKLAGLSQRGIEFVEAYENWKRRQPKAPSFPGLPYVALHSLSHALMLEIALDSGYPSTSLTERIYAHGTPGDAAAGINRCGILIYTSGGGAQGTLGGLVEAAERIPKLISGALERMTLCSNDPICGNSTPTLSSDRIQVNGSACHGCLFVAETSCERRNMLLDRDLLKRLHLWQDPIRKDLRHSK